MARQWSVLLQYPDYAVNDWPETYYTFVAADSVYEAIEAARRDCMDANNWALNEGEEWDEDSEEAWPIINDLEDFAVLLVLEGWHTDRHGEAHSVPCGVCKRSVPGHTAHYHQDIGWIGAECCWDERLRPTA